MSEDRGEGGGRQSDERSREARIREGGGRRVGRSRERKREADSESHTAVRGENRVEKRRVGWPREA